MLLSEMHPNGGPARGGGLVRQARLAEGSEGAHTLLSTPRNAQLSTRIITEDCTTRRAGRWSCSLESCVADLDPE